MVELVAPASLRTDQAGLLEYVKVLRHRSPRAVRNSASLLADFQRLLISLGIQLHWPEEIQTNVR